jgi:hypothetical protein
LPNPQGRGHGAGLEHKLIYPQLLPRSTGKVPLQTRKGMHTHIMQLIFDLPVGLFLISLSKILICKENLRVQM